MFSGISSKPKAKMYEMLRKIAVINLSFSAFAATWEAAEEDRAERKKMKSPLSLKQKHEMQLINTEKAERLRSSGSHTMA